MRPVINLIVGNTTSKCFVDTGSTTTIIKFHVAEALLSAGHFKLKTCLFELESVTNNNLDVHGSISLPFKIGSRSYMHDVVICNNVNFPGSLLIGTDLLKRFKNVDFNFPNNCMPIQGYGYNFIDTYVDSE